MRYGRSEQGFTLVELMIVVLIIGILVMIVIPVFSVARENAQRKACYANERVVEGSYNRHVAVETSTTAITAWPDLMTVLVPIEIAKIPLCPGGGTYSWVDHTAICSIHGSYHDAN